MKCNNIAILYYKANQTYPANNTNKKQNFKGKLPLSKFEISSISLKDFPIPNILVGTMAGTMVGIMTSTCKPVTKLLKEKEDKILADLKEKHPLLFTEQIPQWQRDNKKIKLTREQLLNIAPFSYIEGRKEQFSSEDLFSLAILDKSQLEKIKPYAKELSALELYIIHSMNNNQFNRFQYCYYIPDRKNQFDLGKRAFFAYELDNNQFENVKPYMGHIEGREEDFCFDDIGLYLSHMNKKELKRLEPYMIDFKDKEGNIFRFDGQKLIQLKKLSDQHLEQYKPLIPILKYDFYYFVRAVTRKNFANMPLEERLKIKEVIEKYSDKEKYPELKKFNLEKIANNINKINNVTKPVNVSPEDKRKFFTNFITFENNETLSTIQNMGDIIDKFGAKGIPLEYKRQDFVKDLLQKLEKLPEEKQESILKKLEIDFISDKLGYDGLLQPNNLSSDIPEEKEIKELTEKFLLKNKVKTGDEKTDKVLNALISGLPEFVNIIGKRHHGAHQYTIDCHTLKVLQEALSHPKYQNLSEEDKICLQIVTILHDLGKTEGEVDPGHEDLSGRYANNLLEKFKLPQSWKERITEMIKFHNWYARYNNGESSAENCACMFRRPGDIEIAEIFAGSDLLGVGKDYYDYYIPNLDKAVKKIKKAQEKLFQSGNMLFSTKILNYNKIPKVKHSDGHEYMVFDLSKIDDNFDLRQWGLSVSKKSDVRLLFHKGDIEPVIILINPMNEGVLSVTLISCNKKNTVASCINATCNQTIIGMAIDTNNTDIINSYHSNQASLSLRKDKSLDKRTFKDLVSYIFEEQIIENVDQFRYFQRNIFLNSLKEKYDISEEEYGQLYKKLCKKQHLSQIEDIELNGKDIKKEDIINAYKNVENNILNFNKTISQYNELVVYNPRLSGLIVLNGSLKDLSEEQLKFARENNLPIWII